MESPREDDVIGFVLFGLLSLLTNAAITKRAGRPARATALATLTLALMITLEELSQAVLPNRTLDGFDLIASYAGVACGYGFVRWSSTNPVRRSEGLDRF